MDAGLRKDKQGSTLVVGGDGRFLLAQAVNVIIKIAAANGVFFKFFFLNLRFKK